MRWRCGFAGRNDDAKEEVLAITGELAKLAELTVADARAVAVNARRSLARRSGEQTSGRVRRALEEIDRIAGLAEQIVAQTRTRLAGEIPDGANRAVSLHDPDARPIRKGRLGRPVEFGYKAQIADNADGLVLDHQIVVGNPPDAPCSPPPSPASRPASAGPPRRSPPMAATAKPRSTTTYQIWASKRWPSPAGVGLVRPAPRATDSAVRAPGQVSTGSEARINCLKRDWGWRRTLLDGHAGRQLVRNTGVRPRPQAAWRHLLAEC
jgi:IS5 family transposase